MICWIFDLDGVVTSLTEKKITNPQLLPLLTRLFQQNGLVTINTGRSLPFIRQKVMTPLLAYFNRDHVAESLLHNFLAVGEKGNAWIENETDYYDMSAAIPQDFAKKVQQLVEKEFAVTMFFDTTKRTMISLEMHTGLSLDEFAPAKHRLLPILGQMLKDAGLEKDFKLDPSVSAIDIEHAGSGKAKGTRQILDWLSKSCVKPEKFIAFGDSAADIGTGEVLQNTGKPFTFVFVGDPDIITTQPSFPITYTKEKYDKGVIGFLQTSS